jgi:hypothetical protein
MLSTRTGSGGDGWNDDDDDDDAEADDGNENRDSCVRFVFEVEALEAEDRSDSI